MISFWSPLIVRSANTTSYFEKNEPFVDAPGTAISRTGRSSPGAVALFGIVGADCAFSGTSGKGSICCNGPVETDPAPTRSGGAPAFIPPPEPPAPARAPPLEPPPPPAGGAATLPPPPNEPTRFPPPSPPVP